MGLARVTVAAPHRRIDVALPEHVLAAELMPGLLRNAGDDLADIGQQHSGWVLRRPDGSLIDGARTLAAQNLRDGEVLHLVPRRMDWPELEYDDVVDAIATETRRHARAWSFQSTRTFGLGGAGALLIALLLLLLSIGPSWRPQAIIASSAAALLLITGVLFARAMGDSTAGAMVAAISLPFAAVGAMLFAGSDFALTEFGSAQVLAFCGGLFAASVIGDLGVADRTPLFVTGMVVALFGAIGMLLTILGLTVAGSAAVVSGVLVVFTPVIPLVSMRLGKLPTPTLPASTEDLLADETLPSPSQVYARVVRSDQILTGILLGSSIVLIFCQLFLVLNRDVSSTVLVALIAGASLLRARLYPTLRHRMPLLITGFAGVIGIGIAALSLSGGVLLLVLTASGIILAAATLGAGLIYSRRKAPPSMGRFGDVFEVLFVIAIVPVACAVLGVYGHIRGLAG